MHVPRQALALLAAIALFSLPALKAQAGAYPWIQIGSDDVRRVESTNLDLALRLKLIAEAKESIDLAVYDLRPDPTLTLPMLSALREAADRGVRVRVLTASLSLVTFDWKRTLPQYLLQPRTRRPIEYLVVGFDTLDMPDWSTFDGVHEKLLLVDHKYLMTTGRGLGENYLRWLDTDFAIRGGLATQAQQAFDDAWSTMKKERPPLRHSIFWQLNPIREVVTYGLPPEHRLASDGPEAAALDALSKWIHEGPEASDGKARGRLLHLDLFRQLRAYGHSRPTDLDEHARAKLIQDPVLETVIERLKTAREARLVILSIVLHPRLKAALLAAQARGADLTIFTNIQAPSVGGFEKREIVSGDPIWQVEANDLDDLLAAKINVRAFQVSDKTPWVYLHRKLAVIDDAVIIGSHNLNLPSSIYNDEMSFEIENPALARQLARLFDADLATNSMALDPAQVHATRSNVLDQVLAKTLRNLIGIL